MKSYSEYKKDCLEKRQKKIDSMKIDVRTDFFNRYDRVNIKPTTKLNELSFGIKCDAILFVISFEPL